MINDIPFFGMLKEKMRWLSQSQRVVNQNIANSDTPNYKAQELQPLDFKSTLRNQTGHLALERTSSRHVQSSKSANDYRVVQENNPYETSANGNSVVLEEQTIKMNSIGHSHDLAVKVTRKYLELYRVALGKSGR
jgi:flagellar basal-body rod protein FlgB